LSENTLKARVLRAVGWGLVGNFSGQILRLISNLLLTRMLAPEAFGLMSIIIVLMVGLGMIADTGTTQALIRSPNGHQASFRATVWTVQVVRGFVLAAACLMMALVIWLLAHFGFLPASSTYAHPDLPFLICGYCICPIIHGFMSTKLVLSQRALKNRDTVINNFIGQFIAIPVTVSLAYLNFSVWALMIGIWVSVSVQVVLSHVMIQGERDHFGWDKEALAELAQFGRWVMFASWMGFFAGSGDRLLLSGLIDARNMGLYAIAFLLVNVVQMVFSMLIGSVVFPAVSEVNRDRPHDLPSTYQKFQRLCDVLLGGFAGALALAGPSVVALMYDQRYHGAHTMLQILCVGVVGMRFQVMEQIYMALGRPALMTLANALRIATLFVAVPLGYHWWGVTGAVWGVAASQFAGWPVALWFRHKEKFSGFGADLFLIPSLAAGGALGFGLSFVADALAAAIRH